MSDYGGDDYGGGDAGYEYVPGFQWTALERNFGA